jgi:hypothetical protein
VESENGSAPVTGGEVDMHFLLPVDALLFEHPLWLDKKKDSDGRVRLPLCSPISTNAASMCVYSFGWLETDRAPPAPRISGC